MVLAALSMSIGGKLVGFGDSTFAQLAPTPITLLHMCEGSSAVPSGWITTDEQSDPACNFVAPGVTGRMLTIQVLTKILGGSDQATVCADAPVPQGFIVAAFGKAPPKCASPPTDPNYANTNNLVKVIRMVPTTATSTTKKKKPTA